ncbi:BspA family leucine-rich repeat surface protein [Lactococcus lactis]|uniref:BspA family leucine-rich repeat surface protein n=1 Tax=Lactococcus lactis TaxID=1358 RepID=UPI0024184876|nr:BspA family leucine-rich repeat surface protein [Lactococcus lactis]MDG4967104.1 BspA family leucine-rich repeat surface protein [Lactococcus lactis]
MKKTTAKIAIVYVLTPMLINAQPTWAIEERYEKTLEMEQSRGIKPVSLGASEEEGETEEFKNRQEDINAGLWGTAPFEFDDTTKTMTVFGGTLSTRIPNTVMNTVKTVVFAEPVKLPANVDQMFSNALNLISIQGMGNLDTSNVTNMSFMFNNCSSLTNLDVTHLDTTNVTDMSFMFNNCSSLTNLDVTHFNTSNVINMKEMFSGCSSLVNLDVTHFNTSNVINMKEMFSGCSSLVNLDVTQLDTSNVTDMSSMFSMCSSLVNLDVTHFDTHNVTTMGQMFSGCSSLINLDVTHFDTSNVTNMNQLFAYCSSLIKLDLTNFNTSHVITMSFMFDNCFSLQHLDLGKEAIVDNTVTLPSPPRNSSYTGRWQTVGTGSTEFPKGDWEGITDELYVRSQQGIVDSYVWQPVSCNIAAYVTVNYVDKSGKAIANVSSQTISGNVGDFYDATTDDYKLEIPGYMLDERNYPSNAKGTLSDKSQTVTYIYEKIEQDKNKSKPVIVHYQDNSGNKLSEDATLTGDLNTTYQLKQEDYKYIKGYDFKEIKGEVSGIFTIDTQEVTLIYTKSETKVSEEKIDNSKEAESKAEASTSNASSVSQRNNASSSSKYLPTTGEKAAFGLSFTGLSALVLASYYYFRNKK